MNQILLANQSNNDALPDDLKCLFSHARKVHQHNARVSDNNLFVPSINSTN